MEIRTGSISRTQVRKLLPEKGDRIQSQKLCSKIIIKKNTMSVLSSKSLTVKRDGWNVGISHSEQNNEKKNKSLISHLGELSIKLCQKQCKQQTTNKQQFQ
jgi:hypothetical protein